MVQEQVFLKGGLTLFLFNIFKVYYFLKFRNYFTLSKIVLGSIDKKIFFTLSGIWPLRGCVGGGEEG